MRWSLSPVLALLPSTLGAQDTAAPGFELRSQPYPAASPFAATTTLSHGELIVFDGQDVLLFAEDGTLLRELGSLDAFAFPSFVQVDPNEEVALVGESSTGG